MADGIAALGPEAPAVAPRQEFSSPPLSLDDRRRIALIALRPQVKQMLGIVPGALAVRYRDGRMQLSPEESEQGTEVWCGALDAVFPELEKLVKILAVLGVFVWTGGIVLSRVVMVQQAKKRRADAAREEGEKDGDASARRETEDGGVSGDDPPADPRFR